MRPIHYFAFLLTALLLPVNGQGQNEYKYLVKGRVVDNSGRPVSGCAIVLLPREPVGGCLINHYQTDSAGRFRFKETSPSALPLEQVLYVISDYPNDAYAPIGPPFTQLHSYDSLFAGLPLTITNQETDVGDVPVQVRYGSVILEFQNHKGQPLFSPDTVRQYIRLRIRDARGDIASETGLSEDEYGKIESGLKLALPEGKWQIEMAFEAENLIWHSLGSPLKIRYSSQPLRAAFRISADMSAHRPITSKSPELARRELEKIHVPYTAESLIERAKAGNVLAVRLLLDAGIDPNSKGEHGTTALIRAAAGGFTELARLLLSKGADVNAKESNGATALMAAAGSGNSASVRLLLENRADANARTKDGMTSLMMAVANDISSNVEILLAFGVDVNAKDKNGKSALRWATELDRTYILELLQRAGAKP